MIEYTKENFIKAAVEFCTDESGIVYISNKYHIAPGTIKKAAAVLLSKEYEQRMRAGKNRLLKPCTKA